MTKNNYNAYAAIVAILLFISDTTCGICLNVETYTGRRHMQEGEFACAAIEATETTVDIGKFYLRCNGGTVSRNTCGSLR